MCLAHSASIFCCGLRHLLHISKSRRCVSVDPVNDTFDATPEGQIGKHLHDTPLIGKGWLLEDRQVLHHAVVDDVLHDLVDEVDLPAVQVGVIEILGKGLLGGVHVQAHDFPNKFTQGLGSQLCLVVLAAAYLAPQNILQLFHIIVCQRNVGAQLCDSRVVRVLADIELRLGLVILQVIALQI